MVSKIHFFKKTKRGKSTSILTDVQCGGFVNFEARTPIFGVWPPLTMGINEGLSNWIKFGRSLQKKFALACLGKKVTGKVGQNFLMYKCPVWEPWGIPRCKWGPHPKSRVSSFKIDESPTLDVRENGSGYSPLTLISRENCRFFGGVKNSWKCCGFGHFSCWQLWFHEKNCQKN